MVPASFLPPTPPEILEAIYAIEERERDKPQINPEMEHHFHAGMYARTCRLPAGGLWVGVLIKIPTLLIVNGGCFVLAGDRWYKIEDYQVIQATAGRKQVYATFRPTEITMIFPTSSITVEEAEDEFTDEAMNLLSRKQCQV
jgi:hypothetical protein